MPLRSESRLYFCASSLLSCQNARAGYPAFVRQRIEEIAYEEATHVGFLQGGLSAAGVKPTKACKYSFPYKTVDEFLALSR